MVAVFRSGYVADIRNFLLNQENIAAQRKIIELNIEFTDRVRAFIPKVIADRLEAFVERERMTVLQASVEVLRPRKCDVACLFSDIRGFTQSSKERLEEFVDRSVIPEVKTCSDTVERRLGIPRKIGDLVFVYWDDPSVVKNALRAVISGMEIARTNEDMNATVSRVSIRRYILISTGDAIVGNIGGLDSSIEITALGTPVNFLSRLDEATKHPAVATFLQPNDILVCARTMGILRHAGSDVEASAIDLRAQGVSIRDFPEAGVVYSIKATDVNYARLLTTIESSSDCADEAIPREHVAVAKSA
jgi:class 3 adenylate cyclase